MELLVVIAIIALLVSILMPSLQQALEITRTVQCSAQMHALGLGFITYAEDNNGKLLRYFPYGRDYPAVYTPGEFSHPYRDLEPYTGGARWLDPGATNVQPHDNKDWWHYGYPATSPAVNQRAWPAITASTGKSLYVGIEELPTPSEVGILYCKLPVEVKGGWYVGCLYTTPANGYCPQPLHGYGTQTNVVRYDGSARTYPWAHLVSWTMFPQCGTPPAGFTGLFNAIPRNYLWTGHMGGPYGGWTMGD